MADYSLDQYKYNQKLRLYNSEGRENVGYNDIWDASDKHYIDTVGSTMGLFSIDVTSPPAEPITICSFKNGNTYRLTWHSYDPGEGTAHTEYHAWLRIQEYDKNGNPLSGIYTESRIGWLRTSDQTPATSPFYYIPPSFNYQLNYSDNPTGFISGGAFITHTRVSDNPFASMPDLRNAVTAASDYLDWYSIYNYNLGYSFKGFMDHLGEGATPKKPEDDTNDPKPTDPDPDPDYDPNPDPIPWPDLPTGGDAISTGFIRVYAPTSGQLQTLAGKLWDDGVNEFHDIITKIQNDPMEAIISLHSVPYNVVGTNRECVIGNYSSGVTMPAVTQQWYTINLGSLYLAENWASALDYAPYNQIDIFLPYIGVRSMQVDDVVGKTISVKYNTDVLSGATVASIMCGDSVLYSYNTVLSNEMPITQSSYGPMYSNILNGIGNVLSGYGAAGAPGAGASAVGSAINVAMSKQHSISRGGSIGGTYGCMSHFYPYLIIHRPIQSLASGFKHFKGYPSNITTQLSAISGYTEIESIHLDGIKCTQAERDEIRALLYNGVIL